MKLAELFFGEMQSVDQIKKGIADVVFQQKEQGIISMAMSEFIEKLHEYGIKDFVDSDEESVKSLVGVLTDMPKVVTSATVSEINFNNSGLPDAVSDQGKAQDTVAQAADSANPLT
jgi:hypothetical protein|tara:strand:+ start:629 stop:976 length:348 start_codon:yes stop_codon:yes gene_type:complete